MEKKLLLHTCCGPCTIYPLDRLRSEKWTVRGFFYNPYIQPYRELRKRLESLQTFAESVEMPLITREDYDLEDYLRQVAFREENRCILCYSRRVDAAARLAGKSGFDAFTTTLLYSRLQNHELIHDLCRAAAKRCGVDFFYEDFREGWRVGQEEAKRLNLYRQQYCGCILSEKERFCPSQSRRKSNGVEKKEKHEKF